MEAWSHGIAGLPRAAHKQEARCCCLVRGVGGRWSRAGERMTHNPWALPATRLEWYRHTRAMLPPPPHLGHCCPAAYTALHQLCREKGRCLQADEHMYQHSKAYGLSVCVSVCTGQLEDAGRYAHAHTRMHACTHTHTHTHTHPHPHLHTHTYTHACTLKHAHMHARTHACMHTHTRTNTQTYIHAHTHTHMLRT